MSNNTNFVIPEEVILPSNMKIFETNSGILYLAPDIGSAILTNEIGDIILKNLKNYKNIEKTLEHTIKYFNGKYSQDTICNTFIQLLGQINIEQFSNDTKPYIVNFNDVEKGLHIYLTEKCNLSCIHCYNALDHAEKELSLDEFKTIINFFAPYILKINISGGEPMSSPYFFPLIEYINKKYPKIQLSLFTNGTFISSQEIANQISKYFEEVQVSIDGASKEIVDSIRGKGAFDKITRALTLLANTNIEELAISICLFKNNVNDLINNLLPLLETLDPKKQIKSIRFSKIEIEGKANSSMPYDSNDQEIKSNLANLQKTICKSGRRIWDRLEEISFHEYNVFNKPCIRRLANTCSFGQTLVIDSNGDIYPCAFRKSNGKLGNFFDYEDKDKLIQDWNTCFSNHTVDLMKACKDCDIRYFCCGGCRIQNYNKTGFYAKETCDDKYKQKKIEEIAKDIKSRYSKETSIMLSQEPIL